MSNLLWIHEDFLRDQIPNELKDQNVRKFFVWDEEYFQSMNYSFKRLVFIYETLCEMQCEIYRGKISEVVSEIADQNHQSQIWCGVTPNPILQKIIQDLRQNLQVHQVNLPDFVVLTKEPSLKRFFNYWNVARKTVLTKN